MRKLIPFLLAAAVSAPLFLTTPAQAQSLHDIQRLEEQVQEAKARGNWGAVQDLEVRLNMARLQYQRNNGLGEVNDRGYYNNGYYNNGNRGYYPQPGWNNNNNGRWNDNHRNNRKRIRDNRRHQQPQRGYYDQWGRWRSY